MKRRMNQAPSVTQAQTKAEEARAYAEGMILVGMVVAWDGDGDLSEKWMIRDGRLLESSSYPDLFAVLGTRHNLGGEAAGQFRLPDARGRALVGAGQGSGLTNRPLGSRFGAETYALTVAQMTSHDHGDGTTSENTHGHNYTRVNDAGEIVQSGTGAVVMGGEGSSYTAGTTNVTHDHAITPEGGGAAHNNLQPSLATNTIVRCLP